MYSGLIYRLGGLMYSAFHMSFLSDWMESRCWRSSSWSVPLGPIVKKEENFTVINILYMM